MGWFGRNDVKKDNDEEKPRWEKWKEQGMDLLDRDNDEEKPHWQKWKEQGMDWLNGDDEPGPWWKNPAAAFRPVYEQVDQVIDLYRFQKHVTEDPYVLTTVGCAATASFLLGYRLGRTPNPWRRLTNMADVPSRLVGADAPFLRGRVVSVSDGDTVRFLHAPTRLFHSSTLDANQKLSEVALPIRICTIDTPETAKFGKEGQPFGEEAKQKLKDMADQKLVQIRLLTKDQYGRGVAELRTGSFWPFVKYADEEMLQAGFAEVYQGGGAVYGHKGKVGVLSDESIF